MKFTDNYIKMAEKAVEVQEGWEPEKGDWYYYRRYEVVGLVELENLDAMRFDKETINNCDDVDDDSDIPIFLPLQHQLQGMIEVPEEVILAGLTAKWYFTTITTVLLMEDAKELFKDCKSPEEIWLTFIMMQHNKAWNGEDWVDA